MVQRCQVNMEPLEFFIYAQRVKQVLNTPLIRDLDRPDKDLFVAKGFLMLVLGGFSV